MSQSASATQKKAEKKGESDVLEQFNVQQFVVEERELEHGVLALDLEMKHGQIRTVNATHKANLMQQFRNNPPMVLDLMTVLDQGMFPVQWHSACACLPTACAWNGNGWGLDRTGDGVACLPPARDHAVT